MGSKNTQSSVCQCGSARHGHVSSHDLPTCLPLRVCCITRHFSTDISSLNVMKPNPRDMPSGFLSTCRISRDHP